jgi:carboxylesterase 2
VLIFGESAGGYSVKQLIAQPPSPLPFSAAIMESEASGVKGGPVAFNKLASALGCNATAQLACVRAAPATKIKYIIETQRLTFGPIEDGKTMLQDVRDNIRKGKAAKVPVIIGTNKNEGTPFIAIGMTSDNVTVGQILGSFAGSPELGDAVIQATASLYPKSEFTTDRKLGAALFTDIGFQCPAAVLAQTFADSGYSVRRYFFSAVFPEESPLADAGAYHSAEILPIFKTYNEKNTRIDNLSNIMQGIWTGFAKSPEASIANWPPVTKSEMPVREFGTTSDQTIKASSIDARCGLIGPMAETQGI